MNFLIERFETPALLWHFVLVAALMGLTIVAIRNRRRRLGAWPRILESSDRQRRGWQVHFAVRFLGLACLVVAMAGPRWGEGLPVKTSSARDLIVVLDLSRSMAAEQPSRLDKAVRSLRTLTDAKTLPPGTRVGLVVFASKPWLAFPLTSDANHLAATLNQLAAGEAPSEIRDKNLVSGTRIGAAVKLAVDSFPVGRVSNPSEPAMAAPRHRDILLLSDGDDPIPGDEWQDGLTAARTSGIPVHVVAVGEPGVKATIPYRGDVLRFEGEVVTTEVQRERLDEIARRTDGLLLTVDRGTTPVGGLLAQRWAKTPLIADVEESSTRKIVPVRRWPWLLMAIVALMADGGLAWPKAMSFLRVRPRTGQRPVLRAGAVAACALLLVSAGPAAVDALRQGQEAYRRGDFAAAIAWFDKAQPLLSDPGLVAFNRGAARFRLRDFAGGAADYRRVLDDAAIPADRRDRAWFDLGNCLLHQAGDKDRELLVETVVAYKNCLKGSPAAELKRDAEFNLDIAVTRLAKLQPPKNDEPKNGTNDPKDDPKKDPKEQSKDPANSQSSKTLAKSPNSAAPKEGADDEKQSDETAASGKITRLEDTAAVMSLTPEQTAATLAAQRDRIAESRRRERRSYDVPSTRGKDW